MNIPQEDEEFARRVAGIMGEGSAAAEALRELQTRRLAGQDAFLILKGDMWLVGTGRPGNDVLA